MGFVAIEYVDYEDFRRQVEEGQQAQEEINAECERIRQFLAEQQQEEEIDNLPQ